ncbi:MAG: OmpA family protein [Myxococcales bacterium]|nr:OmpA family protein [Myxococcales bacterium]
MSTPRPLHRRALALALALPSLVGGCMWKEDHERRMNEAFQRLSAEQEAHGKDVAVALGHILELYGKLGDALAEAEKLAGELATRDQRIDALEVSAADLQRKLDDATALHQQLAAELERAGKNVGKLVTERGALTKSLEETKARLEELRKAQEAANKRADLMRELLLKFKRLIDSGELDVVLRDGRMVLRLRNDVLFDSGKVALKDEGKKALEEVAGILATFTDRRLEVVGHTDNVPIATERFPSNWELSTARGVAVVRFLLDKGVRGDLLEAAGKGEYDPVAPNDTPEARAKNRRIEIVLQPNLGELVQVPELGK